MAEPTSKDFQAYNEWLASQKPNQPGAETHPETLDQEFGRVYNPKVMEEGLKEAVANEKFLEEHQLSSDAQQVAYEASLDVKERRATFFKALNALEFAYKQDKIPANTTFDSLYKFIGQEVVKIKESEKVTFSLGDKDVIAIFKALIELKKEDFNEVANLLDIIEELDKKYEDLKDLQ
jgi:hypothetical protein